MPVAMFFASFAWSFVFVSLPFHIQAISTVDPAATLRWAGWILGISSLVTVLTGPAWGRLAGGGNPKVYYVLVEVLQGVGFFGMATARTLSELFLARFALGFMGASSTFAFMNGAKSDSGVRSFTSGSGGAGISCSGFVSAGGAGSSCGCSRFSRDQRSRKASFSGVIG